MISTKRGSTKSKLTWETIVFDPNNEDVLDLRSLEWSEVAAWLEEEQITTHKMDEHLWKKSTAPERWMFLQDICVVISYFSNPAEPLELYKQWETDHVRSPSTAEQNENEDQMEPSYIDLGGESG